MHIFPYKSIIKTNDRYSLNGHCGGLLWLTGLPASGKSTLAHAVEAHSHKMQVRSYVLDGDNIRRGLNKDLGLSPEDRKENIRRIAEVAKLMVDAGLLVFASFITPYKESRQFVRELMKDLPYYECYIKCPVDICKSRDPKGLYKKAARGEITDMTGVSAIYEEPEAPDLTIETDRLTLDQAVDEVMRFLINKGIISNIS